MLQFLFKLFSNTNNVELQNAVKRGAFLVDVRTPQEFASGNVKGSVNIPLNKIQNQLQAFKNKTNIIVFCRSGNRSSQAISILKQNNFTNIINGGTWQNVNKILNNKNK